MLLVSALILLFLKADVVWNRINIVDGSKHTAYLYMTKPIGAVNKMEKPLGQVLTNFGRILVRSWCGFVE